MTKEQFIKRFGENPEDVLGPDWKNNIEEYLENSEPCCICESSPCVCKGEK